MLLSLAVSGTTVLVTGQAQADPVAPAASAPAGPDPAAASASAQAAASGQPVEVTADTTETTQVMANPDSSFTLTSDRDPVRVHRDGVWTPIDTTLTTNPDGSLSPAVTTADIMFSGGGTGPALTLRDPSTSNSIAFTWPTALPVPSVDGDTATYASVLPGVDLQLSANSTSYSEVLVVHDAAAAANPALTQLQLQATATGLSLAKSANGGLQATDSDGAVVFTGSTPGIWDSTIDPRVGPTPTADDPGSASVTPIPVTAPVADGTDGSADTTVTLTPPAAALQGPDVHYPVFIDPDMSTPNRQHFEVVFNQSSASPYYDDTSQDMKVGLCDWPNCDAISGASARSYFSFDTTDITRRSGQATTAHIFAASVSAYETHNANGCTAEPVDLYTASALVKTDLSWPGPAVTMLQELNSNLGDSCGTAGTGAGMINFNGAPVIARLQSAANSGTTTLNFGLVAPDPTDRYQWKRFNTNPQLTAKYNFPPSATAATGINTSQSAAFACGGHIYTTDSTPTLTGQAQDNNRPATPLALRFNVYPAGSSTPRVSSGDVSTSESNYIATGSYPVSSALPDGDYQYAVDAHFNNSNTYIDLFAGESARYAFSVRHNPPTVAPAIVSRDYPVDYWGANSSNPSTFGLSTNGASSAVGFAYSWDSNVISAPSTCAPAAGDRWLNAPDGTATITAPSTMSVGPHTLYVRSFDAAHNLSTPAATSYRFYVAPATGATTSNTNEAENVSTPTTAPPPTFVYAGAPSQTMVDLNREVSDNDHATSSGSTTDAPLSNDYAVEVPLGLIAYTQIAGTAPIYDCTKGTDHFTSTSSTCEGQTRYGHYQLGYIYTSAPANLGTHAIYRCRTATEHFDSLHSDCEGQTLEIVLGYALNAPTYGTASFDHSTSGRGIRFIPAIATNQTFTIRFTAPVGANYAIGAKFYTSPNTGTVDLTTGGAELGVDGNPGPINTYSTDPGERFIQLGGAHFDAGLVTITGTISVGGSGGYAIGLDYLTIAPVNNVTSVANNHGISLDNVAGQTADFNDGVGTLQSLSATALRAAGLAPGALRTIDGIPFTMPSSSADGSDNTIPSSQSVLTIDSARQSDSYLYLLVASTGQATPDYQPTFAVTTNLSSGAHPDFKLPTVPLWTTQNTTTEQVANGAARLPGVTLDHYNVGSNATNSGAPAYLYVIRVPLPKVSGATLTSIGLPGSDPSGPSRFHILAVATN